MNKVLATKDELASHPVATAWRVTLAAIVDALAKGDYRLSNVSGASISASAADQIESYLDEYGETLDHLPSEAWASSVSQWTGNHWDVLVDLWTIESGESDLVLSARVFDDGTGSFLVEVDSVSVP